MSFKRLVNLLPKRGRLIAFDGSEAVRQCCAKAFCAVERYGFAADSLWRITDLSQQGSVTRWTLHRGGEVFAALEMRWPASTMR